MEYTTHVTKKSQTVANVVFACEMPCNVITSEIALAIKAYEEENDMEKSYPVVSGCTVFDEESTVTGFSGSHWWTLHRNDETMEHFNAYLVVDLVLNTVCTIREENEED